MARSKKSSTTRLRTNNLRTRSFEPLEDRRMLAGLVMSESTFKLSQFRDNLNDQMKDSTGTLQVTGYAFEITQRPDGNLEEFQQFSGSDGLARKANDPTNGDPSVEMTEVKRQEIASVSKTITAVGVLRLIQDQSINKLLKENGGEFTGDMLVAEINAQLDRSIGNLLPYDWVLGNGIESITIRELLTHTSGIIAKDSMGNTINYANTESGLNTLFQQASILNTDSTGAVIKQHAYLTTNYTALREIFCYLWDDVDNNILAGYEDGTVDFDAAEESLGAIDGGAALQSVLDDFASVNSVDELTHEQLTSGLFKYYLRTRVLEPSGIVVPDTKPADPDTETLLYFFPDSLAKGVAPGDLTLTLGGRGWNLSAHDLQQFISNVRYNNSILIEPTRQIMDEGYLGWDADPALDDPSKANGDFGEYLTHAGNNFAPSSTALIQGTGGTRANTVIMQFPNDVQGAFVINSQEGPDFGKALTTSTATQNEYAAMINAYDNAWTELVYEGDNSPDDFTIQTVSSGGHDFVKIETPTDTFVRRAETLEKLTIRGLGGNDTFNVLSLPDGVQLILEGGEGDDEFRIDSVENGTLVTLNGDAGNDTFIASKAPRFLETVNEITFNGGADVDTVVLNDQINNNPFDHAHNYFIGTDQLHRQAVHRAQFTMSIFISAVLKN